MDKRLRDIVECDKGDEPNPNGVLMRSMAKYEWYFANGIKLEATAWDSSDRDAGIVNNREFEYEFTDRAGDALDDDNDDAVVRFVEEMLADEGEPFLFHEEKNGTDSAILRAVVLAIMRDKAQEYARELGDRAEEARSATNMTDWTITEIARTGDNDVQAFWAQRDNLRREAEVLDKLRGHTGNGVLKGRAVGKEKSADAELRVAVMEETIIPAELSVVPGLALRRPIPVVIEEGAGDVVARWIEPGLTGIGDSEGEAMASLADIIVGTLADLRSDVTLLSNNTRRMLAVIEAYVAEQQGETG